jgi:hypothetical protein
MRILLLHLLLKVILILHLLREYRGVVVRHEKLLVVLLFHYFKILFLF